MRLCGTVRALCALFVAVATKHRRGRAHTWFCCRGALFRLYFCVMGTLLQIKVSPDCASYIARCASSGQPSSALPFGLPTTVAASTVRPERAHGHGIRWHHLQLHSVFLNLTVDKEDFKGFAQLVRNSIENGSTPIYHICLKRQNAPIFKMANLL